MISSEFKWYGEKFRYELNLIPEIFKEEAQNCLIAMKDDIKNNPRLGTGRPAYRTYTRTKNGITKKVEASYPGSPPNNNFGDLIDSLNFDIVNSQKILFYSDSPYAVFLEFGTHKMAARPFFRRNVRKSIEKLEERIKQRFPNT